MSELHFPDLTIKGYRGIRELSIPQLGRVNLITGKNNTGKSSVLEALRLHAEQAESHILYETLEFREDDLSRNRERLYLSDSESLSYLSALFLGFPETLQEFEPISISTDGELVPKTLEMRIDRVSWVGDDEEEGYRLVTSGSPDFDDSDSELALILKTGDSRRSYELARFFRLRGSRRIRYSSSTGVREVPCILVRSNIGGGMSGLAGLWDSVALTSNEQEVVEALRIIDPRISRVSMLGAVGSPSARRAVVLADGILRPVSLRSFGDGMNRLFEIALSLVNADGGLLLIDEFENGLHYSVQPDVWRMIFQLSSKLNIQVFATTHSKDTVEAFQKAASKSPEEGVLVHLTSRRDDIIPTVFTEPELAIVTRDGIEVR